MGIIPPHQVHEIALLHLLHPGIVPKDDLVGNAWKQSAMEAWLPLMDILVGAVANNMPAPAAPPSNSVPWLIWVQNCDPSLAIISRAVPCCARVRSFTLKPLEIYRSHQETNCRSHDLLTVDVFAKPRSSMLRGASRPLMVSTWLWDATWIHSR